MIIMIATIRNQDKGVKGFRLIDSKGKTMDTTYESIVSALISNKCTIDNLRIEKGKLIGHNGSIDRYPILDEKLGLVGKSPLVIIAKTDKDEYVCSDYKGQMQTMTKEHIVGYANKNGISNGKIVSDNVSAIEGNYRVIEASSNIEKNPEKSIAQRVKEYNAKKKMLGVKGVTLAEKNGVARVSYVDRGTVKAVIPNFVTVIGKNSFTKAGEVDEVVIPNSIKIIDECAFEECYVPTINIPESVVEIRRNAFLSVIELAEVIIPDSVKKLGVGIFASCEQLVKVQLPQGIEVIPDNMFEYCYELKDVNIPNSVKVIGKEAFRECDDLEEIKLPSGLKRVEAGAFKKCYKLDSVKIPESVEFIGGYAFQECILTAIVLGKSIKEIEYNAFYKCRNDIIGTEFHAPNEKIAKILAESGVLKSAIIVDKE